MAIGERFRTFEDLQRAVSDRCWETLGTVAPAPMNRSVILERLRPFAPESVPATLDPASELLVRVREALSAADAYLAANPTSTQTSRDAASLDRLLSHGREYQMNRPDREADGSRRDAAAPLRANTALVRGDVRLWLAYAERSVWDLEGAVLDAKRRTETGDSSAPVAVDLLVSSRRMTVSGNSRARLVDELYRFGRLGARPGELPEVNTLVALSLLAGHFPDGAKAQQRKPKSERPTVATVIEAERKTIAQIVERLPNRRLASLVQTPSTS